MHLKALLLDVDNNNNILFCGLIYYWQNYDYVFLIISKGVFSVTVYLISRAVYYAMELLLTLLEK